MPKLIAVTGCCGFIGRYVTEALLERGDYVYGVDALTYAADPLLPARWLSRYGDEHFHFTSLNINDLGRFPEIDAVINLAAETHVDNSITDSRHFLHGNFWGVANLLEMCRAMRNYEMPRFIQISTDEVYGDITEGASVEDFALRPSSPYAATKASADLLVQAWGRTYGVPYNIVRPSNCYGAHQYPEKLIPKAIRWMLLGKSVPIHGNGTQTRYWLDVNDCVSAILCVLDKGHSGHTYDVPGNTEASVRSVVNAIAEIMHFRVVPTQEGTYSRSGMDQRYHVEGIKLGSLGWAPSGDLFKSLPSLVEAEKARFRW